MGTVEHHSNERKKDSGASANHYQLATQVREQKQHVLRSLRHDAGVILLSLTCTICIFLSITCSGLTAILIFLNQGVDAASSHQGISNFL